MGSQVTNKLSFWALIALVVGSMIGAGVFSLPSTFGRSTGALGAIIAWCIAGGGMLMLAFVFQNLAKRKPDLDTGIFAYAQAGFGNYIGFLAALGFWGSACIGNVSYFILIKSTLGAFFPVFGDGNTIVAIVVSSVILWSFHFMIMQGVKGAAIVNTIATVAKIVPLVLFLVIALFAFQKDIFSANFFGYNIIETIKIDIYNLYEYGFVGLASSEITTGTQETLFTQVRSTMLVTVFVFLGIEGASVYSRYAKNRKDVGVATVIGFLGVLLLFILITLVSYGIMSRAELAELRQPSVAGVLRYIVGDWGAVFVSVGLIISVLGAFLSWTLLASEVLFAAAKNKSVPAFLTKENANKVPIATLWMTSSLVQIFLIATYFASYAFTLALELTSAVSLFPYLFIAAYAVKLVLTNETYENDKKSRKKDLIIASIATFYSILMLYAGGLKYILLSALIFAPGTLLYYKARKEQNLAIFTRKEVYLFIVLASGAVGALFAIFKGYITI